MYLLSQMWAYLALAFLIGAIASYLYWRTCLRPMLESRFEHSRKDAASRLSLLEDERAKFSGNGHDVSREADKLRGELATLRASHADGGKALSAARDEENKLKAELSVVKQRIADQDADAAKHAAELKRAREDAAAEAARRHADEIKKARDQVAAEWTAKHTAELKKGRDEVTASLTAVHAGEVKKLQDTANAHETKVLTLTQADGSVRQELDAAKARHADELKKTRDSVAAEWTAKHDAGVKKAREDAAADAARCHADELAKLKDEHAVAIARHSDDLAKAKAAAASVHAPPAVVAKPTAGGNSKADDLKLIWGVGPEIEKLLNDHGIHRFEQIANWKDKDLAWFDGVLPAFKGRAVSEKWIEQCRKLVSGWRPEREIGDKPKDILTGPRGGKADDLKLIWGVGPKLEAMLNTAGFYHFDQIAKWTDREIEWVDTQLGDFAGRAVRDKWVEQCKKLATGWRPASDVGERPT